MADRYRYSNFFASEPPPSRYSLLDEEDEAARARELAEVQSLRPTAAMAPPAIEVPEYRPNRGTDYAALLKEQDEGEDVGNALANYGLPAVASLLDLALNKGRGVGAITQSAALQANQRAVGRRELAQDRLTAIGREADRAQRDRYYDYLESSLGQRGEHQAGVKDRAERGLKLREEEAQRKYGTSDPQAAMKLEALSALGVDVAKLKGASNDTIDKMLSSVRPQIDLAMMPAETQELVKRAGGTSAASERARTGVELDMAPLTTAAAAEKAAAETSARNAVNEPKEQRAKDEQAQEDFATKNKAVLAALNDINAINARRDEKGNIPGFDLKSRALNALPGGVNALDENAQLNLQDAEAIADKLQRADSGAAAPVVEAAGFVKRAFSDPLATQATRQAAFDNLQRKIEEQLRGQAVRPEAAQKVLDRSAGGESPVRIVPGKRGQESGGTMNAGGARRRTIKDPQTGETETDMLTDAEAETLRSQGLHVQ